MHPIARNRWHLASLALLLPLALAAEEAAPKAAAPAAERTPDELRALAASIDRGMVGTILHITEDSLDVRDLTEGSGGSTHVLLAGGPDVAVTGLKQSWDKLAQGDLIVVSYRGDPARAQGIRVLPPSVHPEVRAAVQQDLFDKPRGREFVGWIKRVDAQMIVLRTPNGPPGSKRTGSVKTFLRHKDTAVELLRDSWDELKKGDRVVIAFSKGEPSPADRVKVVLRGGEKPLPRGLATRLFDPAYDQSVKDVDGIGEWPPGKPWPPAEEPSAESAAKPAPAPASAPAPAK
jgi:hypothetical protein